MWLREMDAGDVINQPKIRVPSRFLSSPSLITLAPRALSPAVKMATFRTFSIFSR
jgi:hypothetical protein